MQNSKHDISHYIFKNCVDVALFKCLEIHINAFATRIDKVHKPLNGPKCYYMNLYKSSNFTTIYESASFKIKVTSPKERDVRKRDVYCILYSLFQLFQ